jgi:exosortase
MPTTNAPYKPWRDEMLTGKLDVVRKAVASKRNNYPHVFAATLIILAILIVYWQDLSILANEALQSEAVSQIILIPFLISYLIYRKRELVKASLASGKREGKTKLFSFGDVIGVALCLSALLFYWYGSYTFYALEYHIISLPLFAIGAILILSDVKTLKALIFPILFLLFLIPPPSTITYAAGGAMANLHTQASYTLLKACGLNVTLESAYGPPTIILKTAQSPISFAVDLPCSGIYSLVAFIMFAAFLSYIIRGSIIKKVTLFLTGFLILQVLNIARISIIVLIGNWLGEEIAMSIFHFATGWILIFIGTLTLLLIAEKIWKVQIFAGPNKSSSCPECNRNSEKKQEFCTSCGKFLKKSPIKISKSFWIKIAALLLGCYLVTLSIQAPVFALARTPEALSIESPSSQAASTQIFPNVTGYQPIEFLGRARPEDEEIAHLDAYLVYMYFPVRTHISERSIEVDVGVASSISNLHGPEVCYVTYQESIGNLPTVTVLDSRDVQLLENPPIIAKFFTFRDYRPEYYRTQVTLYWYEIIVVKTGLTVAQKYVRISLLIYTSISGEYASFEEKLLTAAKPIVAYWEPKTGAALISLGIAFEQVLLVIAIGFVAVAEIAHYTKRWREKSNNLRIFERFASSNEKLVLKTLKDLSEKTKITTTDAIDSALRKTPGNATKDKNGAGIKLNRVLNRLEESKIIHRDIENVKDKPIFVWKP